MIFTIYDDMIDFYFIDLMACDCFELSVFLS